MGLFDKLLGKKPTYEVFAREMIGTLEAAGARDIRHDPATHSLRLAAVDSTFYLDNAFSDYAAAPSGARPAVLQGYAKSFTGQSGISDDYAACKSQLLPVVRDPAYYSLSLLALKARGSDISKLKFVTEELAPGLCVGIAQDTPNNILTVGARQLETWKITAQEALAHALCNLREKTDPSRFKQLAPGLYAGAWGDCYDTARILMPEIFHRLSLDGDPVVFLPKRDALFVTGAYNSAAMKTILQRGGAMHLEHGHSLSPNLYVHTEGKWSLFTPGDPAVAAEARAVKYHRDAKDYDQQKKFLDEVHKRERTDLFVASCQLYKRKDESLFTRCVWTKGVDSLLPVTEELVLVTDLQTKELLNLSWSKARPIVAPLLEGVPDLLPVRYRARTFPSAEQLQALRQLVG